jgi:hypothetical protein
LKEKRVVQNVKTIFNVQKRSSCVPHERFLDFDLKAGFPPRKSACWHF